MHTTFHSCESGLSGIYSSPVGRFCLRSIIPTGIVHRHNFLPAPTGSAVTYHDICLQPPPHFICDLTNHERLNVIIDKGRCQYNHHSTYVDVVIDVVEKVPKKRPNVIIGKGRCQHFPNFTYIVVVIDVVIKKRFNVVIIKGRCQCK